jgi:hypothetical protein
MLAERLQQSLKEQDHLRSCGIENSLPLKLILKKNFLEAKTGMTTSVLMPRRQSAGQNVMIANRLVANVAMFKYFGAKVTNQSLIHETR